MPRMVKKTIELDQDFIDRARAMFGARTEKQAVNRALELAIADDEIVSTHAQVGGKGRVIEEVFE
jgi:Arc/MetJ family transcription regulator